MTLRQIAVRVRYLPVDSATMLALGGPGWRTEHFLAAHIYAAVSGEQHPSLPKQAAIADPAREKRRQASRARARERQRAIEAGEIT